jgi:hypothetical protein
MGLTSWASADDWWDEFLTRLLRDSRRRNRLAQEKWERPGDQTLRAAAEYDAETENLRRFIAGQKESTA